MVLGTKKAAHIGGASGHHGPKLHKLVAVQIIEVQQRRFFVPQLIKLQLVIGHDLPELWNVKGSQPCTAGNQYALGGFSRDKLSRTF